MRRARSYEASGGTTHTLASPGASERARRESQRTLCSSPWGCTAMLDARLLGAGGAGALGVAWCRRLRWSLEAPLPLSQVVPVVVMVVMVMVVVERRRWQGLLAQLELVLEIAASFARPANLPTAAAAAAAAAVLRRDCGLVMVAARLVLAAG